MKRTIPLLITALGGFLLIVANFIPATEDWGDTATIWFDILAGIAFVLGGANLLVINLRKVSDQKPGWAYAMITLVSFLAMLGIGLLKLGSPPAPDQEYFGESFAELPLMSLPEELTFSVPGKLPEDAQKAGRIIPASARQQFIAADDKLSFRGWMLDNQLQDLIGYSDNLKWRADIERLHEQAQPPSSLAGKVRWYSDHSALSFTGAMDEQEAAALKGISSAPQWQAAVTALTDAATRKTEVALKPEVVPASFEVSRSLDGVAFDPATKTLSVQGELTPAALSTLRSAFPVIRPMNEAQREALWNEFVAADSARKLDEDAKATFIGILDTLWTKEQLVGAINTAGKGQPGSKSWNELYEEQKAGAKELDPSLPAGPDVTLNEAQIAIIDDYIAAPDMKIDALITRLAEAGTLAGPQRGAIVKFLSSQPTRGRLGKDLTQTLLSKGLKLSDAQLAFLLDPYRQEIQWGRAVQQLADRSHVVKYPFSGEFAATDTPFWWLYEYVMQPLQATVFALLAFYVASAAFRAFRVKNVEATLLLGTAFIILLGRTFAGVWLTSWIPPDSDYAFLRIENMTVWIMSVINTAGSRAIMIGIALGIISTSLKVLLAVDRSYLGSDD